MDVQVKEFDHVVLNDGRDASVIQKLGTQYLVDVGTSPLDWHTIRVERSAIAKVIDDSQI